MAIERGSVQRRGPARPTAAATRPAHSADSPQAQTAHPLRSWAFTTAPDAASDRTIRRLPYSAAQCSAVMPYLCTAGPGCGGGPHGGTPVPKPVPENKTAGSPRGSTMVWVTVNDREYSERTRSSRHLAPRSRIHPTCQTSESRGNGDCGRRRRREIMRLGKTAGERTSHGT